MTTLAPPVPNRCCRGTLRGLALVLASMLGLFVLALPGLAATAKDALRIGDTVALRVPGEAALSQDFKIDRQGQIILPEVGAVVIAGLTATAMD